MEFINQNLISTIFSILPNIWRDDQLREELEEYLSNLVRKFRFSKNVLFRNEPVDFYQDYIQLNLQQKDAPSSTIDPLIAIRNYDKIIINGTAGSGKTTLLKFITLEVAQGRSYLPIYLELRRFEIQDLNFEDFLCNSISKNHTTELKKLFEADKILFLFDGFDEINYTENETAILQIQNFIDKYSKNSFVISTRPGTHIETLPFFHVLEIAPLDQYDISNFIDKSSFSRSQKEVFYEAGRDLYFLNYLVTPLFLSVYLNFIITHHRLNLPSKKSVFFRSIIDTLFSKHDSVSKLGFVRQKISGLNKDQIENIASVLAFRALIRSTQMFTKDGLIKEIEFSKTLYSSLNFENEKLIYDLTITVNVIVAENNYFSFPHVLIQEYLAALFVSKLSLKTKSDFYKKILVSHKFRSTSTFLNFLYELDNQNFLKQYFLPNIDLIDSYYSDEESKETLVEFLKIIYGSEVSRYRLNTFIEKLRNEIDIEDSDGLDELFLT